MNVPVGRIEGGKGLSQVFQQFLGLSKGGRHLFLVMVIGHGHGNDLRTGKGGNIVKKNILMSLSSLQLNPYKMMLLY